MKKLNVFAGILLGTCFGLLVMRALLSYLNYTRHAALFAANGWLWYTDVLTWSKWILPVIIVCFLAKCILRKK